MYSLPSFPNCNVLYNYIAHNQDTDIHKVKIQATQEYLYDC